MNNGDASRASRRELCVAVGLLLLAGCCMYIPHVVNGNFTIDDWGHAATAKFFRNDILETYWLVTSNRPVLVVYVPLTFIALGPHPHLHLAWALLLAVAMAAALYALLRRLRMQPWQAGAIALLVLLFPWSDSARLWATASHIDFAIFLAISGLLLALRGLDERAAGDSRREYILHAGAVVLYALSVLTYEIAGVVLLFAGALYLTRASWRVVGPRWAIDSAVIATCLGWTAIRGSRVYMSLHEMVEHGRELANGAAALIAHATFPFWSFNGWAVLVLLAAIALSAVLVRRLQWMEDDARPVLRRWLIAFAAGVVVAGAGWILYVPANPYYQIDVPGVANRTNVMAAIGVVVVVYSAITLLAVLLLRGTRGWQRNAGVLATVLVAFIAVGYARQTHRDEVAWAHAADESEQLLANVKAAVPDPPPGSTIYTFDYPGSYSPNIIVFSASWDLNGAIKLAYDDPTLSGYPIIEGTTVRCGPRSVGPSGPGWTYLQSAPYGTAFFVDAASARAERIDSRRQCLAVVDSFAPGPLTRVP